MESPAAIHSRADIGHLPPQLRAQVTTVCADAGGLPAAEDGRHRVVTQRRICSANGLGSGAEGATAGVRENRGAGIG